MGFSPAIRTRTRATYPQQSEAGLRPIGSLPALYRVALRCRRPALDAFEASIRRPYFSAQRGVGPIDQVWRSSLRAEATVADGDFYGAFQ